MDITVIPLVCSALRPHPQLQVLECLLRRLEAAEVLSILVEQLMCHIPLVKSRLTGVCVRETIAPVIPVLLTHVCITRCAVLTKPLIFVSFLRRFVDKNLRKYHKSPERVTTRCPTGTVFLSAVVVYGVANTIDNTYILITGVWPTLWQCDRFKIGVTAKH